MGDQISLLWRRECFLLLCVELLRGSVLFSLFSFGEVFLVGEGMAGGECFCVGEDAALLESVSP